MRIQKIGVVGAGLTGRGIAALAASAGVPCVLLDVPGEGNDRNSPARKGLTAALKSRPASFMDPDRARLIEVGNIEDDLEKLADCDWIVEAITEQPEPKQQLYARLEEIIDAEAIVTSNTSDIPMSVLVEGRSDEFRERFLGTHFFNPPRYLHLLEVIPTADTSPEAVRVITEFSDWVLGKGVVLAKDVPGFIGNRLAVHGMIQALHLVDELDLTFDEADVLTGLLVGRSKSATFRTADTWGLDVMRHTAARLSRATGEPFDLPAWVHGHIDAGRLGDKTGGGFYRKEGEQILTYDRHTGEYELRREPEIPGVAELLRKPLAERIQDALDLPGKWGEFERAHFALVSHYTLEKTPDIAYDIPSVDRAMEWGYAWAAGPFRQMEAAGPDRLRRLFAERGLDDPKLLRDAERGFYCTIEDAPAVLTFDNSYAPIPPTAGVVTVARVRRDDGVLEENDRAALLNLGDGVALLELRAKTGTIGAGVLEMIETAIELLDREGWRGLVIGHEDPRTFSAGANLVAVAEGATAGEWQELKGGIRAFQNASMSLRRAPFPVVCAPFGLALGGACELSLHCDLVQAHAELYTGLVEAEVGLLPGGGGTKELLFRFTEDLAPYGKADPFEAVRRAFDLIAMAKTSNSAADARKLGFLRPGDRITMNRQRLIADAKKRVLDLFSGYVPPPPRTITALGKDALGNLRYGIRAMHEAGQITDHEVQIGNEIAYVLCGGDGNPREVTEQDILDLEREAFLRLLSTEKTQERIAHTLKTGKPLRN